MCIKNEENFVNLVKKIPIPLINVDKSIDQRNSLEFKINEENDVNT